MSNKAEDYSAIVLSCLNLAAALGFPEIGAFVAIASPLLQRIFTRAFIMVARGNVSDIGRARLGVTYQTVVEEYNSRCEGDGGLNDNFLPSIGSSLYTKADEIVESTLWNVVYDAESEKSILYGQFLGRIPFLEHADFSRLFELLAILRQLTNDEVKLLHTLGDNVVHDFSSLESGVHKGNSIDDAYQFGRLLHLKSLGLIIQQAPFFVGASLGRVRITSLGIDLLNCLG